MSAKEQVKKEIIEAYVFLRTNNMTIPSETLEFMKDSSLEALDEALTLPDVVKSLKDKEAISFKEWIKLNKHTDTYNDFLEGGFTYTLGDLYREYSKDETSL